MRSRFSRRSAACRFRKFDRNVWGGSAGGPVKRDKTFFFGAAEVTRQNIPFDNNIRAADAAVLGLPSQDFGAINQFLRDVFAMGKVNQTLNENNSILATYAMTRDSSAPLQSAFSTRAPPAAPVLARPVGAVPVDESGGAGHAGCTTSASISTIATTRSTVRMRAVRRSSPTASFAERTRRASTSPTWPASAAARLSNEMFTRSVQGIYHSTISKGSHVIKFGVDALLLPRFDYINYTGPSSGTYSFSSLNAYLAGQYTTLHAELR